MSRAARPYSRAILVEAPVWLLRAALRFVDEDQALGDRGPAGRRTMNDAVQGRREAPAPLHGLTFFSVILWRAKNLQIVDRAKEAPCSARSSRSSARVMSGLAFTASRITGANPSFPTERLSPPTRSGRISPVVRTRDVQRIALEMLTPTRAAAWRRDSPPSTAAPPPPPAAQIDRQRLRHACRPPHQQPPCIRLATLFESQRDSARWKIALV